MSTNHPILVTGSNRSGSTWVGNVLTSHGMVDNIIEPLNVNRIQRFNKVDIKKWYLKIDGQTDTYTKKQAEALYSYYLNMTYSEFFSNPMEKYEGHNIFISIKKRLRRAGKPIKMIKDPMALFAIPWLVETFNVKPVILIRHPAAYALSIKEKKWLFDFNNLLDQPNFFTGDLECLKEEVKHFKRNEQDKSTIENASLLWKVFYKQVASYKNEYPQWLYSTHEALSLNPIEEFKKMFKYLDLDFNSRVEVYIKDTTQSSKIEKHKRDAIANSTKWKERLNKAEIDKVYNITYPVCELFYDKFSSE